MKRRAVILFAPLPVAFLCGLGRADSTVVLSEIQYHPVGDETQLEWVELYNQMAVDMDISGWSLSDGVVFELPDGTIVPGGGFVVVAASPSGLEVATGFAGALGPFEGRLDNSGETVELRNNSGRIMDSVKYKDSGEWPAEADGSGATLAKVHPDLGSASASSWTASALVGGTPGEHNFPVDGVPRPLPRDVISYWSLDQTSGSMLDIAGGNNGTVGSGATRVAGIVGAQAVSFNNTTSAFISVGSGGVGNTFSTTTGITVEAIIQPAWGGASGDQDEIFRKDDGDNRILLSFQNDGNGNGFSLPPVGPGPVLSFGLNVGGAYTELDMLLDGQGGRPSLGELKDGAPHHVAATYDSATGVKAIYVDGGLVFSVNLGAGKLMASGGTTVAYIGNMSGRAEPFTGVIDEVAIWKRALSAAEILGHWDAVQLAKSYFAADGPSAAAKTEIAFNEAYAPAAGAGWVELMNFGPVQVELKDHVVARAELGGEYVFPARPLAAGGYLTLAEDQLGFDILAGQVLFLYTPGRSAVVAAVQVVEDLRARRPDGTGKWLFPDQSTPGAPNSFRLHDEIVINEILYNHRPDFDGSSFSESPESWIELFNRGAAAVSLTGWTIRGGIDYAFADGTTIAPGEYVVVAKDSAYLRTLYPALRVAGDFTGSLSHASDRILLADSNGNPADEVRYQDGGRWPEYADGGGSSLELRDPDADNSKAEAWAASDESGKASWKPYTYDMIAAANVGPTRWNELVMGLLDAGEALVDDLHAVETPDTTPKELLQNGTFAAGTDKWRLLGNHRHSSAVTDPDDPSGMVLHLVATGATEHMHNHLETTYAGGSAVVNGRKYRVSFRAKWLAGSNQLNTRLYFNRCPKTTLLDVPALNGTPGARNSRYEGNIGPTYDGFGHAPAVPAATEAVAVSITAQDPDGVSACAVWYSVNAAAWRTVAMAHLGSGRFQGTIPAQAASALVQFYVEGTDGLGAKSTYPAAGPDSRAMYKVNDGQAVLGRVHNVRIVMTAADTSFLHTITNVMSNDRLGCTIIYDERRAFYDAGIRLKGSERGRDVSGRVGFNIRLDPDDRFRGVHESIQVDRSGGWKFGGPSGQDEIVIKHIAAHAGDIPCMYDDLIRVIAPQAAQNGPALLIMAAYRDVYLDSQYPRGSDGNSFELELVYYPTSTVDGRPEGLKRPEPDDVIGTDFRDLGNDKEPYRLTFLKENHRAEDDYSGLMALCKAFGLPTNTLYEGTLAVMDPDEWMRAFVLYSLCGITDAYTRGNNHNLIVYQRPEDGKFLALPWDLDFSWVQATNASLWGDQNLGRITQLTPNRRLFYCHLLDVIETTYNPTYMARWTAHYGGLAGQDYSSILTFIGQRRTFVLGAIPAKVAFAIATNSGNDFSVDSTSAVIEGNAWFDVKDIFIAGLPDPLELTWPTQTRWQATVDLKPGANRLGFFGFDRYGGIVGSDEIVVTSTVGAPPPAISSVTPAVGTPGQTVTVRGSGFQTGIRVFFGAAESPSVTFNEAVDPGALTAKVPALPDGIVPLTVRNADGRTSAPRDFTVSLQVVFVRGDVNLDASVDLSDVLRLVFHLYLGAAISCQDAADATNNEVLDVADAIFILNYLFRGGASPSAPFPQAGMDQGAQGVLGCEWGV